MTGKYFKEFIMTHSPAGLVMNCKAMVIPTWEHLRKVLKVDMVVIIGLALDKCTPGIGLEVFPMVMGNI